MLRWVFGTRTRSCLVVRVVHLHQISNYVSCTKREHLIGPRHLHFPRASDEQLTSSSTSTWLLELGGSKAFLKPRAISTLKKEFFHSPFSGGYAASFCGNSASAANAVEDKEAGGRAKAAATRGAAEGRWSAERGGRSDGVQSLGSRGRGGSARSRGSRAESWCMGTSGEAGRGCRAVWRMSGGQAMTMETTLALEQRQMPPCSS